MFIQVTINGEEITSHVATPIKWNALLDERLDEGRLSIRQVPTKLYPIGVQVAIIVGMTIQDTNTQYFIISADESTEMPVGSGKYNHELSLIEPTKLLEGIVVESLTFSNPLKRNSEKYISPLEGATDSIQKVNVTCKEDYIIPRAPGKLHIFSVYDMFTFDELLFFQTWDKAPVKVYVTGENFNEGFTSDEPKDIQKSFDVNLDEIGVYTVDYQFSWMENKNGAVYRSHYWFDIIIVPQEQETLPQWNIASVINRVLNLAEPHLATIKPRFHLDGYPLNDGDEDGGQHLLFSKIEAPEFAFTKCTLKEILDQIGGYIHGIPRLVRGDSGEFDTIRYDMLNDMEEAEISKQNTRYITEIHSHNIEDYVTELDSTVDNLVNTLDSNEGAVTEPYAGGFKSVRSETAYARIEEDNMVISTTLPIYSVQKLEVIDTKNKVGDITDYLYEGADYGRLSSFDGSPISKAYAIYYNLGERNIKGLGYKSPNVNGAAKTNYAITNIIKAVTGDNLTAGWWGGNGNGKYPRLAFRITYTPIFSARILQHKPYVEPGALKRSLVYNQGANLVETRYYGENMKGAIARMGNPEFTRTYRMRDLSLVPTIGQIFKRDGEDYYISSVTVAVYPESVDFTVGMSKDFNRLSQYIGINSEWRAYEVSERKAYNRDIVYRDFLVIGNPVAGDNASLAQNGGINYVANTFTQNFVQGPLTVAQVTTYDEQNVGRPITLPVVSTAFGNAMVFSFGMADNYSAGAKSVQQNPTNEVTGYWQTDVPYVDYYGRVKSMEFMLGPRGDEIQDFGNVVTFALPDGDYFQETLSTPIMTPDKIIIDKNGTEILRVNYQLEFVSNQREIIIGPALAHNCPMVTKGDAIHAAAVYVVNKKIGRFDSKIDLSADVVAMIRDFRGQQLGTISSRVLLGRVTSTAAGVAWVIADQSDGAILIAQNMDISAGDTIQLPNISLVHNLP